MVCVDKYMHKTYYVLIGLMVFLLPQAFILLMIYHLKRNKEGI